MADITLTPKSPLGGKRLESAECTLEEMQDITLISMATPLNGEAAFEKALKKAHRIAAPKGMSTTSKDNVHAFRTGADQVMLAIKEETRTAVSDAVKAMDGAAYLADQTDAWVTCAMSGTGARRALERLCPLDLHDSVFPVGTAGRTNMEHMGSVIMRVGENEYWLFSASSSAQTFWHALETSIHYTTNP